MFLIGSALDNVPQALQTEHNDAVAYRPNSKSRVAFVGTGYIADWHARALACIPELQLVAVCDVLAPRAQAFAEKFRVPRVYRSLQAMLAKEKPDAVHILLPPDLHFQAAQEVLHSGISVLLEKPMCIEAGQCQALVRLAAARNLRIGVGHNYLFADPYVRLRQDLRAGILGPIDQVVITWYRELVQLRQGPFDIWMLQDPCNIMLEVASHPISLLLDLVGQPSDISVQANNSVTLPSGQRFYRHWQVHALCNHTAAELRFSFVPGFAEYGVHVRGALGSATVDFERNTYMLQCHRPLSEDFDRYALTVEQARSLRSQARRTLREYVCSKFHLRGRGNPYQTSIVGALRAFYAEPGGPSDQRICGQTGAEVTEVCEEIGRAFKANLKPAASPCAVRQPAAVVAPAPRILVLGGSGFIGQGLLHRLLQLDRSVRVLLRSPSKLPSELRSSHLEVLRGDLASDSDLRTAMEGIHYVYHLARADAKTWTDWQREEIEVTRRIAQTALTAGIKRLIYTGTIDSFYAGKRAGTITDETPLDAHIGRRNFYARAKAASEAILLQMHQQQGLPVVILRPGIVIGRGGSPFHWGVGMWSYGAVCQFWGDGRNKLPLVLVDDVADALVKALETRDIDGQTFNLVGDFCLSARQYIAELNRCGRMQVQQHATSILKFYLIDLFKWLIKVLVRHPERRFPSYRDWESRTQRAVFDCTRTKKSLGWHPASDRNEVIRRGISEPLMEALGYRSLECARSTFGARP
jgi:predicted dehydrogenase/nucleoside-diphosphate-sugar epimerase